jgi:hypothetical protein
MSAESGKDFKPRIVRLLDYLNDEIKSVPIGYRKPFTLIQECLIELAESQDQSSR